MKRKRNTHVGGRPPKRARDADQSPLATTDGVDHPVLSSLYPKVSSLRHYLLSRLPTSSKNRRRKISQLGAQRPSPNASATRVVDIELGELLDSTLVGVLSDSGSSAAREEAAKERDKDIESFSQQLPSKTTASTFEPGYWLQAEIVDFVVWRLFKRTTSYKPSHLLCHGFQRSGAHSQAGPEKAAHSIPGLIYHARNAYVEALKEPLWCRLHAVLGQDGYLVMMDLLTDCGIFTPVEGHGDNYVQISGQPLSELRPASGSHDSPVAALDVNDAFKKPGLLKGENRKPSAITFVRSRMLYARAALNAKGGVRFGMRHIHVLNRCSDLDEQQQTVHIMRYIFPRQFGLHNVFTSKVDKQITSMPFKDYTLREDEIHESMCREVPAAAHTDELIRKWKSRLPKRLRGDIVTLVNRLRKLNKRCSYMELLRHYCPVEGVNLSSKPERRKRPLQPSEHVHADARSAHRDKEIDPPSSNNRAVEQTCFTDMACPTAHVSAFCRAVIAKVIPNGFWGDDHNKRMIMYWIDQFICLRRAESLNLHQVTQKLQLATLAWLRPPGHDPINNMAKSDFDKRQEILLEFVYWVFDSFLIPLIRSNFHVTESNVHRQRLFYFRHDVWRMLSEPSLATLKVDLFEEVPTERATKLLSVRSLGFSNIRLLPKRGGVRLITNLKRRAQVVRNGNTKLSRSINSVMDPAFRIITYEKLLHPEKFGCSMFSIGDMFPKLASFKLSLQEQGLADCPFYFAKVDVQSCFDTIPQKRLLSMVESLLSLQEYQTGKHVEIRPLQQLQRLDGKLPKPEPRKRWITHGGAADSMASFGRLVHDELVGSKANTVFVDTDARQSETKHDLMRLLREHIERNLVKIGKRIYRQKTGIPQGSVLSTILCNFFYAELERDVLSFALGSDSLLLRLLDDFCLITTNREHAERFIRVMHRGHADYGVSVKAAKSLVNFTVSTENGRPVGRCVSDVRFPYCGVHIDMHTLEVSKHSERTGPANMADSLTVDLGKVPGQTFHRKALNAFKIQLQAMLIDTSFNSVPTVLANLHQSLLEAAVRLFEYARALSKSRPIHPSVLIKTVDSIMALAFVMLQRRTRTKANRSVETVRSVISQRQVQWLACKAFEAVFQRRQTQHGALLARLRGMLAAVRPSSSTERCMLEGAIAWRAGCAERAEESES